MNLTEGNQKHSAVEDDKQDVHDQGVIFFSAVRGAVHCSETNVKKGNPQNKGLQEIFKFAFYRAEKCVGHTKDAHDQQSQTNLGYSLRTKKENQ